jgi:hypothetical protein
MHYTYIAKLSHTRFWGTLYPGSRFSDWATEWSADLPRGLDVHSIPYSVYWKCFPGLERLGRETDVWICECMERYIHSRMV